MTLAKGITNATVPMGAVCVAHKIYDTVVNGAGAGIELFHGYTYSGHPLAAAAGLATLEVYRSEALFERAASLESYWADAVHSLRGLPHVIDLRNIGLVAGIELEARAGAPGARGFETFLKCFEAGVHGSVDRRHDRAVAAAHRREAADRSDVRRGRRRDSRRRLSARHGMLLVDAAVACRRHGDARVVRAARGVLAAGGVEARRLGRAAATATRRPVASGIRIRGSRRSSTARRTIRSRRPSIAGSRSSRTRATACRRTSAASLNCTSCHLDEGRRANAAPLVGAFARFPKFMDRSGAVVPIEDRVNYCFTRSLAGSKLPADSREMQDIVAYLAFISKGVPNGEHVRGEGLPKMPALVGDSTRGAALFVDNCARCHGTDGAGMGPIPALWGPTVVQHRRVDGATGARGVVHSPQHAVRSARHAHRSTGVRRRRVHHVDGAARFAGKENDWPNGGDVPYDVPYDTKGHKAFRPPKVLPRTTNAAAAIVAAPASVLRRK